MILGICGSPRDQTTNYVLNIALSKLKNNSFKTIDFEVRGKDIHPCQHCDYCLKNKNHGSKVSHRPTGPSHKGDAFWK